MLFLSSCSPRDTGSAKSSKWMTANELFADENDNSAEAVAMKTAFDKDNGSVYCVPKMSKADLGELKIAISGYLISTLLKEPNKTDLKDFDPDKPMQSGLRLIFKKRYPC
jgi:hypothetical protein